MFGQAAQSAEQANSNPDWKVCVTMAMDAKSRKVVLTVKAYASGEEQDVRFDVEDCM